MQKTGGNIKDKLIADFESNKNTILADVSDNIKRIRLNAFDNFKSLGIPTIKDEEWRFTDIEKVIDSDYTQHFASPSLEVELKDMFRCDVPDLNTIVVTLINGWYPHNIPPLNILPDGTIIGSFAEALKQYPDIVEKYYTKYTDIRKDGLVALNTAFAKDGIFVYIPENTIVEKPIQIINVIYSTDDLMVQHRNLFIAGKNSQAKIVTCDHSLYFNKSFVNSVTEIVANENSIIDLYKVQNFSNNTFQHTTTEIHQEAKSKITSNVITLHGGFVRNNTNVLLNAEGCEVNLYGLYLCDREQHIDNHTFIEHAFPNCHSNEKYKGIIDDKAKGVFSGKVLVKKGAQKTNAYQANNNILLTDDAKINSKPQLEIYADDVKCSHGATIGQLDEDAMFYLRSRGINEHESRMMLMYAFTAEIINKISIEPLRERIDDLVSKRLKGELSRCNNCMIKCG